MLSEGMTKGVLADHHHIFVGDLAPETTSEDLKMYFGRVAEVS